MGADPPLTVLAGSMTIATLTRRAVWTPKTAFAVGDGHETAPEPCFCGVRAAAHRPGPDRRIPHPA